MSLPEWTRALREQATVSGLSWLDEEARRAIRTEWLDVWSHVGFEPGFHARCRERLARCVPLAIGPSRERRLSKTSSRLTLVFDPEHPELVATSLSHALPSACWSLSSPDELARVLAPYLPETSPARTQFRRVVRVVKPLDVDDPRMIADAIDALELWIDDTFWGSRYADDPWPPDAADLNMLALSVHVQRFAEQDPERFPTVSCRTLWSRSTVSIEQHPRGLFVFALRYQPAEDTLAITLLNEAAGLSLPLDLPVDVAASLLRGPTLTLEDIDALDRLGESPFESLALRCAAAPSSPPTIERLRAAVDQAHDDAWLGRVAGLASSYRHDGLLFDIAARAGGDLRDELEAFLRPAP